MAGGVTLARVMEMKCHDKPRDNNATMNTTIKATILLKYHNVQN